MAQETKKFLDYAGLSRYDALIKSLIKSGDEELLVMINDLRDLVEGSDAESVDERIAAVKNILNDKIEALEAKHDSDIEDVKEYTDKAIENLIDGAPAALDTLREIVDLINSDESGVAELLAAVDVNKKDIEKLQSDMKAANDGFANHEDRLSNVEDFLGVSGSESEGETLVERVEALEADAHDDHDSIANAEIDALFMGGEDTTVKNASSAADVTAVSAADAKTTVIAATGDEALNAFTESKTYQSIALGDGDLNTKVTLNAVEDVSLVDVEINGREEDATGNGSVNYAAKDLTIENVEISGNTNYNVFEGTQDTTDASSHIENLTATNIVVSDPSIKHNIINVYTPASGANITISDSQFTLNADNSNVLRMANYLNSDNVTITFKNCDWEYVGGDTKWAGLMIYQPASKDAALTGDYSHLATWTIKFINCRYAGEKVTENVSGYNQAFYTYNMNGSKACVGGEDAITSVGWTVVFE